MRRTAPWLLSLICSVFVPPFIPALAQPIIVSPGQPKAYDLVRIRVPEIFNDPASSAQSAYNTIDGRLTSVSMSANKGNATRDRVLDRSIHRR